MAGNTHQLALAFRVLQPSQDESPELQVLFDLAEDSLLPLAHHQFVTVLQRFCHMHGLDVLTPR
jgi:hypothetical protein